MRTVNHNNLGKYHQYLSAIFRLVAALSGLVNSARRGAELFTWFDNGPKM